MVLTLRAGHAPGRGTLVVAHRVLVLTRVYLAMLAAALVAGTATTGAGPHAGGKGAKRVPIGLADMARIHAEMSWLTGMVLLVILWTLWRSDAPARVQESGRILLGCHGRPGDHRLHPVLHPPAGRLVGIHVFGATMVWSTALWFHHGLSDHRPETVGGQVPDRRRPIRS